MSASPDGDAEGTRVGARISLERPSADAWVSPDSIQRNPDNPRLIFRQRDLDELKRSIYELGVLQPLIVFTREGDPETYILIDGERRWRCARELNLAQVPVHVHAEPTRVQNITTMFNIHKLRVDWEPMPTALKLQELTRLTNETRVGELARMTGQSADAVRKSLKLLFFSDRHQQMLLRHEIKDNFLIELHPFIIALQRRFPALFDEYGTDTIVDLLVAKEQQGYVKAVTEFRDLVKIVRAAGKGAPEKTVKRAVRRVLDEPTYGIDTAYASVRAVFDVDDLRKRCESLTADVGGFRPSGLAHERLAALESAVERLAGALEQALNAIRRQL
jgi:ParB family chromosome partitioning protein